MKECFWQILRLTYINRIERNIYKANDTLRGSMLGIYKQHTINEDALKVGGKPSKDRIHNETIGKVGVERLE